ncbi:monocarboxylate transporter 10 [Rhipicephalus sanguineus]|uniref:monocarboxylate transporter 10 n=1 Tax=Rhipicephalus sanguineus TaxID=34632 RepID=UPI001892F8A2|nr:monocarboxylate transporter 10 [Rhipicephalus sanguineus]
MLERAVRLSILGLLLVMNSSCYGFLYVLFMKKYGIDHAEAAWPASALVIAGSCVCIAVSALQDKLSVFHITLVGGLLASLGLVASTFAPNIAWMTFTFGVLHGAGIGTALLGFSLYILLYFDKYSGTAFAVMWVFRAVSGMAGTQLLWHLANAYGVEGSLLITGGLLLHVVPFTMFIKSPSPTRISLCASIQKPGKNTYNPVANKASSQHVQLPSPSSRVLPEELSATHRPSAPTSSFASVMASLRTWPFYAALFYSAMCEYLFVTFNATVVAYGVDKGSSLEDSKQVVIYNSVGLLVGRVVIPFATEKLCYRHCPGVSASFLAAAICFFMLTQVSTYAGLVATASVMGVAQGYVLCMKSVIVADHVGLECFTFCCGVGGLLSVPLWLSGPSIIGFFRDKNGSYDYLYVMLAVLCLLHAVLLGLLSWREVILRRQRREQIFHEVDMPELQHMKEPCTM